MTQPIEYLTFSPDLIARVAHERLKHQSLPKLFYVQARAEWGLRLKKHVNFRKRENKEAREAYREMLPQEFEGINARQKWANWRTIPKNLNGVLPNQPLVALDLCCGVGHSTEVLACYLPPGSSLLGMDYSPQLIEQARMRKYTDLQGQEVKPSFRTQSVLDPFCDEDGKLIPDGSVDLVNSCGAVGSHFDSEATAKLALEVSRVVKRGGLATIDAGIPGTGKKDLRRIFEDHGFTAIHAVRSCFLDPYTQISFRRT